MKKFKIFLLLSILLCFGFVLSSEVHAQGNGPKAFEIGDILPVNAQIRISWTQSLGWGTPQDLTSSYINGSGVSDSLEIFIDLDDGPIIDFHIYTAYNDYYIVESYGNFNPPYTDYGDGHAYCDIVLISPVTITNVDYNMDLFTWEVLNTLPKPFEVGDVLPAGYIKISWDFTGYPMAVDGDFLISSDGDFSIRIWEFGNITLFINDEMFYADTPGYTIITLTETVTITDMDGYDDYYEYIHGALFWEVISQDYLNGFMEARELYGFEIGGFWVSGEQAWNNGYDLGSELAWDEGFEYGMEIYGYYDPNTNRWLSVSEYLDLYGTDKPGQSDFYGNFDKYFIPALIIVFGGAIVLTILKVFKGRE